MILIKRQPRSSGVRHSSKLAIVHQHSIRNKFGLIRRRRGSARSQYHGITLRTRKSPSSLTHVRVNWHRTDTTALGVYVKAHFSQRLRATKGLIKFANGSYTNIAIPHGILPGTYIITTAIPPKIFTEYGIGYTVLLFYLPKKSIFYNIISSKINRVTTARAAGTYCTYIESEPDKEYIRIRIPSGLDKYLYAFTYVTLGQNSNKFVRKFQYGKAGSTYALGHRPSVRGVAMNPVDHPNGGRTKTKSPEKTPWGRIAKYSK